MNWRRIERWATIALYTAASVGIVILLLDELLPAGSLGQRLAQDAAGYLVRLGDVGGGALLGFIFVALLTMGGIWLMVLIAEGVERLSTIIKEIKGKDAQMKAEARNEGREMGREEGRDEMKAIAQALLIAFDIDESTARARLLKKGVDPDIILPPHEPGQSLAEALTADTIRAMIDDAVRERLAELGVNGDAQPTA